MHDRQLITRVSSCLFRFQYTTGERNQNEADTPFPAASRFQDLRSGLWATSATAARQAASFTGAGVTLVT